jgi:hypothetical protein
MEAITLTQRKRTQDTSPCNRFWAPQMPRATPCVKLCFRSSESPSRRVGRSRRAGGTFDLVISFLSAVVSSARDSCRQQQTTTRLTPDYSRVTGRVIRFGSHKMLKTKQISKIRIMNTSRTFLEPFSAFRLVLTGVLPPSGVTTCHS